MRSMVEGRPRRQGLRPGRAAIALFVAGIASPANAAATAASTGQSAPATDQTPIIVTAPPLFRDVQPERQLDEEGIASYGDSTVDELLSEIQGELGEDEAPLIFVNGERINDVDQIGALPVEVLRSVQVLPRGTAARVGGRPGQRVVNLTIRHTSRSATLTAAPKVSTEGDWHAARAEGILTNIRGSTRFNVTFRARGESSLLESERDIIQPAPRIPFALAGNVVGFPGTGSEIDPLLSAAAGEVVTVAPFPETASPTLADFVPDANDPAITDLGEFRTLRPRTRNYDLNGSFSTRLTSWLTSTGNIRLSQTLSLSRRGLPSALFILSPTNPASPFSTDVGLAIYARDPLDSRLSRTGADANLTFDGHFGQWLSNLNLRRTQSKDTSRIQLSNSFIPIPLDDQVNPFTDDLSDLIAVRTDQATSQTLTHLAQLSFTGPAATLPAGKVQTTIEARLLSNRLRAHNSFSAASIGSEFHRTEEGIRGAIDVPIASRENNALAAIGDLDVTGEFSRVHFSDAGTVSNHALGMSWEPIALLRVEGDLEVTARPPTVQALGNPVIATSGVRVFDPLTGQTIDVVQITGGNPSLRPEKTKIRRLSALLRLVPRLNLQLNGEYTDTDTREFVSSLPEASAAVMLAFPDRFIRDANGVLTTIDFRPVNFDSHREKRFRYGLSLSTSLAHRGRAAPGAATRLQLTANHTIVFLDEIRIRPGLGSVDLLGGGAIGIGGGRVRHQLDGTASLTSSGLGARAGISWRGRTTLESRIGGVTDTLHFSPLLAVNLRAFADARRFLPRSDWAKNLRLSLNVLNLTNDHQKVRTAGGVTPLQYQPGYRDPLGRTVELELRKVF
jgi:iron complex outermembrane receptor protein